VTAGMKGAFGVRKQAMGDVSRIIQSVRRDVVPAKREEWRSLSARTEGASDFLNGVHRGAKCNAAQECRRQSERAQSESTSAKGDVRAKVIGLISTQHNFDNAHDDQLEERTGDNDKEARCSFACRRRLGERRGVICGKVR